MSKRRICKSKFHVCYHFLDIHENLRRKDFINPHATNILKQLMEIKNGINFIFTLLCGASKKFYLLEAPKRSSKKEKKKKCPLRIWDWENKGYKCVYVVLRYIKTILTPPELLTVL